MFGRFLEDVWKVFGRVWKMFGRLLEDFWNMCEDFWNMFGICVDHLMRTPNPQTVFRVLFFGSSLSSVAGQDRWNAKLSEALFFNKGRIN